MWTRLRQAISNRLEALLRWLTASVIRSTAIFVILTFVPILLLTYYIVATSIRGTKADAASADQQVRDFAVSLLRTHFRSEREALAGASDETALERALTVNASPAPRSRAGQRRNQQDMDAATASLARLHRRRPEFLAFALYNANGAPVVETPGAAALPPLVGAAGPPDWFSGALAGRSTTSALLPATANLPLRLAFAVQVQFPLPLPPHAPPNAPTPQGNGVLAGLLPASAVADWVRQINVGADRYLYVVDARGQAVAATAAGPFSAAVVAQLPQTAAALHGHSGSGEYVTAIQLESHAISYAALPEEGMALLVVRPVRFGFYLYRVFYDKLAFIAVIIFLLAVATGLLLRSAFRYYQRYNREVETGRAKTEALLGSIGDGVFAVDAEGRIIEFNRAAAALTGEDAAQALLRPYAQVIDLSEEAPGQLPGRPDPVRLAMQEGRTLRFLRHLTLVRRDGQRLPVTVTAAPVRDEQGGVAGCVVVFSDASQEREVDRMKNEFISIASHQLRTPMTGVKGVLSLLLEQVLGPLNQEQQAYLRRAYESNERLIALVNDLLNISRLEQGSLLLRHEPVNVEELLAGLTAEFQARAGRYHQTLTLAASGGAGGAVLAGDAMRLREVFANLLDNAVKYTPEGGAIHVRWQPTPAEVVVEVSDSGVGIPADKLESLFQKFNRIQNPLTGREFGTGLGLYFARSVVELHQGRIEVASTPGAGTTFRVVLPRQPAAVEERVSHVV